MFKQNEKIKYDPVRAIPPGETLREVLSLRGMTQRELATRMNRPIKTISEIVKGKNAITPETSIQLEQVFGISAEFWNNLESNYQESRARLRNMERMKNEIEDSKIYPYNEMLKNGWVPKAKDGLEKASNLLVFFGTTSFKNIVEADLVGERLFRISATKKYSRPAIIAWLRKGVIDSQKTTTSNFDAVKLRMALQEIRMLSLADPLFFAPKLKEILSNCGVAFVITPDLKNAPINGVSHWISPTKAMVQLSIRNKFSDIFWFSLIHELGHLLLHDKKGANINLAGIRDQQADEKELEANNFAAKVLIPEDLYKQFVNESIIRRDFSRNTIFSFAQRIKIDPSIVIGRLQHDKHLPPSFLTKYRKRYEWMK